MILKDSINIILISPTSFNLQKPIEDELQRQGHKVQFISKDFLPHDNGVIGKNGIKKVIDSVLII